MKAFIFLYLKKKNQETKNKKFTSPYNFIQVETSREKIISLELQDPERDDTPNASLQFLPEDQMLLQYLHSAQHEPASAKQEVMAVQPSEDTIKEIPMPQVRKTVEKLHITKNYEQESPSHERTSETEPHVENVVEIVKATKGPEVVVLATSTDEEAYDEDEGEETDTASIVTVQANTEKLFLRNDDDDELPSIELDSISSTGLFGPSSMDSVASSTAKVSIKPSTITMHQTLAREVLVPSTTTIATGVSSRSGNEEEECGEQDEPGTTMKTITSTTQNIVQVVNPLIAGEGQVQRIAISRPQFSEYPSFDKDDIEEYEGEYTDDDQEQDQNQTAVQIMRSETFVLPPSTSSAAALANKKPREELSLNAKMKNVLEELLENERVKYNLQKSLEDEEEKDTTEAFTDEDDQDDEYGYSYGRSHQDSFTMPSRSHDDNANQNIINELIRDSNRNTMKHLQAHLREEIEVEEDGDDDDEVDGAMEDEDEDDNDMDEDDDDDEEDEESEESEDSESSDSDDEDDDDDDETIHISFVNGAKVIENFNTNTPVQLQKSQTYNTMKEAAEAMDKEPAQALTITSPDISCTEKVVVAVSQDKPDDSVITLEKLLEEQKKYAEITKQLRKSVENLLIDDDDDGDGDNKDGGDESSHLGSTRTIATSTTSSKTSSTSTLPSDCQQHKVIITSAITTPSRRTTETTTTTTKSVSDESGEAIFQRLLSAGGAHKQIFDQLNDEALSSTTTTCTEDNGTIVTTTTTISNIVTSGIPRAKKTIEKVVRTHASQGSSSKQNNGDKRKYGGNDYADDKDQQHHPQHLSHDKDNVNDEADVQTKQA